MFKKSRIVLIAGIGLLGSAALANQILGFYPIVGGASYCASTVNINCVQTIPAGPVGLTGNETVLAETNLSSGQMPQGVLVPIGLLSPGSIGGGSYASPKNLFRNGDISVNPFQVGTSQPADIANTVTTGADGFRFVGAAGSLINWSKQTGASDIVANQFTASLRFQRKSTNADVNAVCQISVMTNAESAALQGQKFVYSFWAKTGANFSPTSSVITVKAASGISTNDTSANFKAGTWTTYTDDITAGGSGVTVASGVATVTVSTTWAQYYVSGSIPATATQVGTEICFTPVGTAGTNDWVETSNHQLEIVGTGVLVPTAFEHHTPQKDNVEAQRYLYRLNETAAITVVANCRSHSVTVQECFIPFPVSMRTTPTMSYTAGFATETTAAGGTLGNCSAIATATTVTNTASNTLGVLVGCTATTVPAAGVAGFLFNNAGAGVITASAEL